jgi:hypothetical protein
VVGTWKNIKENVVQLVMWSYSLTSTLMVTHPTRSPAGNWENNLNHYRQLARQWSYDDDDGGGGDDLGFDAVWTRR